MNTNEKHTLRLGWTMDRFLSVLRDVFADGATKCLESSGNCSYRKQYGSPESCSRACFAGAFITDDQVEGDGTPWNMLSIETQNSLNVPLDVDGMTKGQYVHDKCDIHEPVLPKLLAWAAENVAEAAK